MKVVIVGGVAGGASAAARLRRLNETAEIVVVERDEHISYATCGLPYYVGDVITERGALTVQTPKGMQTRFCVDVRTRSEVVGIQKAQKMVTIKNLETGEVYEEGYDKLVLSCGAKPIVPNIKGMERANNVFTLRNIADTVWIKEYVEEQNVQTATVIGGGFIGVEMAENLAERGIQVTLVEKMPQVLRNLDYEMAQMVHHALTANGVRLVLGNGIAAFEENGAAVVLEDGTRIQTQMTILAIGVTPENTLAKQARLQLGARGHVVVSDTFATYDENGAESEDIFAIGDMIEVVDHLDESKTAVPLAWGANRQGRILADHLSGRTIAKSKILGTSVLKVFGLTVATTGANETTLKNKGIAYTAVHAHRPNHASYYPNATNIALKVLYDKKSGRIFGAQAIGQDGTEKRMDVLATTIRLGGTIYDLSGLELCYAPPYSSAKDPVNILGYIAENIQEGVYQPVYVGEIDEIVKNGGYVLDVRTPQEFQGGHIEGAKNIPVDALRERMGEMSLPKDAPIYVYCQVGQRAYIAIRILHANGFTNLYNLSGGYTTYRYFKQKN